MSTLLSDRWHAGRRSRWVGLPHQEWQHFIIDTGEGLALINLSRTRAEDERTTGQVLVMAHGERWCGAIRSFHGHEVYGSRDGRFARVGTSTLDMHERAWDLSLGGPLDSIEGSLRFASTMPPLIARNRTLAEGARLHWVAHPRAWCRGDMRIGDVRWTLRDAPTYHDHNWGRFDWGQDFGWEWGFIGVRDQDIQIVLSTLTNRSGTAVRIRQLHLWKAGRHVLTARGEEIAWIQRGSLALPSLQLPAALGLVVPTSACDAPTAIDLQVREGSRTLAVTIALTSRARVLVPSASHPLGVHVLDECAGTARVEGFIDGRIDAEGTCLVEIARGHHARL